MYSVKFFWNCPYCEALNSYDAGIDDDLKEFTLGSEENNKHMKRKCHYCLKESVIWKKNHNCMIIKCGDDVDFVESYLFMTECSEDFYTEEEYNFIKRQGLKVTFTFEVVHSTYEFRIAGLEEITAATHLSDLDTIYRDTQSTSFKGLKVRIRNILEYKSMLNILTSYYREIKCPYRVLDDINVLPSIFNHNDVILVIERNATTSLLELRIELTNIGIPVLGCCIPYVASHKCKQNFRKLLALIAVKDIS